MNVMEKNTSINICGNLLFPEDDMRWTVMETVKRVRVINDEDCTYIMGIIQIAMLSNRGAPQQQSASWVVGGNVGMFSTYTFDSIIKNPPQRLSFP